MKRTTLRSLGALLGFGLSALAPAHAQQADDGTSDNGTTNNRAIKGPAAAANASRVQQIEGAAEGLQPPGGLYGIDGPTAMEGESAPSGPTPEYHTVKKGDTLWTLCGQYFNDPWRWPKLWSQNPLITNPHWIFPGDVVRLREGDAPADAPSLPAGSGRQFSVGSGGRQRPGALVLREVGYVQVKDLEASAAISGSREEKIMLATGDQAYLTFAQNRPLKAGERYTVFVADTDRPVRDPVSGAVLGYLVRINGDIVVDQVADTTTARGTLHDVVAPIERGYKVSPAVRQFRRIEPRPSDVSVDARIVATFAPTTMLAAETFVVLSRGSKDGLQVGNRTFVVRRGDGYRGVMESWDQQDKRYPKEVVGELLVVDVRDNTSLAWIASSTKEIRVGETTEMHKGH